MEALVRARWFGERVARGLSHFQRIQHGHRLATEDGPVLAVLRAKDLTKPWPWLTTARTS